MRTRLQALLVAGCVAMLHAATALASPSDHARQAGPAGGEPGPLAQEVRPLPARPYTRLFQLPALPVSTTAGPVPPAPPAVRLPGPRGSTVVCGMTVIAADPRVDSKIFLGWPRGPARHARRVIRPPVCGS
jgi:hypothetical protein